jgi:predicted cobalt transporter CbtA
MAHDTHSHGSDKGAAFAGLIGGFVFIAVVVYALVVWTNGRFDAHESPDGGDHAVAPSAATQQVA